MDVPARMELGNLRGDLARMSDATLDLTRAVGDLKECLDRQSVAIKMLISMLVEKTGSSEAEMLRRVFELTAAPGSGSPPHLCPACHRTLSRRRSICAYCGAERRMESVFELLEH